VSENQPNIYQAPESELGETNGKPLRYGGFWVRVLASLIDTILMMIVIFPLLMWIYGGDYWTSTKLIMGPADILINYVAPAIVVVIFWVYRSATPGKMAFELIIVDANTLAKPSSGQLILRYICYYVSMLPLFLGFFWVAFDARKQGWHDKIAKTVVIKK